MPEAGEILDGLLWTEPPPATRVEIDLNARCGPGGGWTFSGTEDIYGPMPVVGAWVVVFESESEVMGMGRVERLTDDLIYLCVEWQSLSDWDGFWG